MDVWHVVLGLAAGSGWGLAIGFRNARDVALGRQVAPPTPNVRALIDAATTPKTGGAR